MLEQLDQFLLGVLAAIRNEPDTWDSLIINRRKPHTYRAFRQFGNSRICLHRFEPCGPEDAFAHPHPWPGAFLMLKGSYIQKIGYSPDLKSQPEFIYREIIRAGTIYEIVHKQLWHTVQPLETCYTIMLNGEPWEGAHDEVRTTKGKDLEKFTPEQMQQHLMTFDKLLTNYIDHLDSGCGLT